MCVAPPATANSLPGSPHLCQVFALRHQNVPGVVLDEVQRLADGLQHLRERIGRPACGRHRRRHTEGGILSEESPQQAVNQASTSEYFTL